MSWKKCATTDSHRIHSMVFVRGGGGGGVPRASTTMDLSVVAINCYRPQTKFAKVMFLQVSVCPQGGGMWQGVCMTGACMTGACMAGACVAGACVAGACVAGGHAWQGGFVARGVCGGGHA